MKQCQCKKQKFRSDFSSGLRRFRRGVAAPMVIGSIVVLLCVGGVVLLGVGGYGRTAKIEPIVITVASSEFVSKVLEHGELRSASNIEIKCEASSVSGQLTVIDLIDEGKQVKEGDWLITLDSKAFEKELEQEQLEVSLAETDVIQAQANYDTAIASKKEYLEGIFLERQKQIENEIYNAEQNLKIAKAVRIHSTKLQRKGFITKLQLENDEISVKQARNVLEQVNQRLFVLKEITRQKDLIKLTSDISATEVYLRNVIKAKEIQNGQLAEVQTQLKNCKVYVPKGVSGVVVYGREDDGEGRQWVIKPGARVRERQVMIQLPDLKKMEVKVLINEQSITSIRLNMPAQIRVDALSHIKLSGVVTKVNSYAETNDWMTPSSVKVYSVLVAIHDPPPNINPGMNAEVSIQTQFESQGLQIPLQCIYSAGESQYVLRRNGERFETVQVSVAGENSSNVLIRSGLAKGDQIVMDPGAYENLFVLPELAPEAKLEVPSVALGNESEFPSHGNEPAGEDDLDDSFVAQIMSEYDADGDSFLSQEEVSLTDSETREFLEAIDTESAISRQDLKNAMDQ